MRIEHKVNLWEVSERLGYAHETAFSRVLRHEFSYFPEQIQAILEERDDIVLTREEVKNRISVYFQSCLTLSEDEDTQEFNYVWKRNPTKSGLALALGVSPQTVVDYVKGSDC